MYVHISEMKCLHAHIYEAIPMKVNPVKCKEKQKERGESRKEEKRDQGVLWVVIYNIMAYSSFISQVLYPEDSIMGACSCWLLLYFPLCILENLAVHLDNCEMGHVTLQRGLSVCHTLKANDFSLVSWACMHCPNPHSDLCPLPAYSLQYLLRVHPVHVMV